jgi:hypothetical protein
MLTLNETFAIPDADRAWSVINDLSALVPCVPGACVKSIDGARVVKAEIAVRVIVRLHPGRCAELIQAGKGRLFVHDGQTHHEWLVVDGLDAAEWTAHTMEALGSTHD